MKKYLMTAVSILALCACGQEKKAPEVAEATPEQVTRVEPPCWWAGMKTDLQLLVQGPAISDYDVRIFGDAEVTGVHKAESPNYLFVDVKVGGPGSCWLVFVKDGEYAFKVPYEIGERREGSAGRKSFTTADLIYLIMPDRFANGDPSNDDTPDTDDKVDREKLTGRHGGDIKGIMDHLDYLEDMGITAIWNTPLLEDNEPRESYHGYACSNYYRIDPRFGDNEMYCELVRQCHARGIKMIMDIVTNHCGDAHWWMKDLPFADWIHQWPEYTHSNCNFAMQNDPNSAGIDQYNMQSGWFDTSMPDMNLDNPYLLHPDINIVGEVWTNNIAQLAYWQDGAMNRDGFNSNLPAIMDFPLHSAFCQGLNADYENWDEGITKVFDAIANDAFYADPKNILVFCSNHDTDRIGDVLRRDPDRMKMVLALTATLRGIPQIFSGDEQMFTPSSYAHHDGGLRVDFPGGWKGDRFDLFTAEGRAACDVDFDGSPLREGVRAEVFDYARRLFNWRKGATAVHDGRTMHFLRRDNTYSYFRYTDDKAVFVFANNCPFHVAVPWASYAEFTGPRGLSAGTDVMTGERVDFSSEVLVGPRQVLIVEF